MINYRPGDNLSDASKAVILAVVTLVTLAVLVFFLFRPARPLLNPNGKFGAPTPQQTTPPRSGG